MKIFDKILNKLNDRLKESYYSFSFSTSLKQYILDSAYSVNYGARPIKRFIQNEVETLIATKIISGEINTKEKYLVDYINNEIIIKTI